MWKTNNVSHISTPPAAATDKGRLRRYTNTPLGTKDRSGHDRFHSPRMFGPCNRMESTILASNSTKLLCLLPTLPNPSRAGQGHSGVESSGEARTWTHLGDSSGRRTSPPLPAPGRLVRRCSAIMAPDIFAWSCDPKRWRAKTRSHPGYELLSALPALGCRTPLHR